MEVEFYGYELKHDENCFTPTTITKYTAINVPVEGKKVLDLGCGIGPLAIYYAKNGAESVTAVDVYDKHCYYTMINSATNNVQDKVKVVQSDLFENIDEKFDIISCDVSGVDRRVAEMTGWFPNGVPTADETGADIICRAIKDAPKYLNEGGDFYLCTAQFSDLQKIQVQMAQTHGLNQGEKIFEKSIPFSRRLLENIENLDPKHYNKKGSRYFWNFGLWRMGLL